MRYLQGFILFFIIGLFIAMIVGPGDNYYRKDSEKVSFPFEIYLIFGIVGGVIGIGVGASWEEDDKKRLVEIEENKKRWAIQEEERQKRLLEIAEKNRLKEKRIVELGLNKITNSEYKDGRKWIFETSWINPQSQKHNFIKTFYNKEINSTITTFNSIEIQNHNSTEGNKIFIEKCHTSNKCKIINDIIDGKII